MHVRGRPVEPIGVLTGGGKGGTPIHGNNPVEANRFQTWKNKCRAMVRRQVKRSLTQLGGDRVSVCVKVSGDRLS